MARSNTLGYHELDAGVVLAPERYDPRREQKRVVGTPLFSIADVISDQVQPGKTDDDNLVVIDTGDARDGLIRGNFRSTRWSAVASSKKILHPEDVIVSRLRPYLRQVAYVDEGLLKYHRASRLVCSTEFFVLRSHDNESIAFLVAFLLSDIVQEILTAAQEGGHHPRFNRETLRSLVIPADVMARRSDLSEEVISAARQCRASDGLIRAAIAGVNEVLRK